MPGALWHSPSSSTKGCSPAGRGPVKRRSQAAEPMPTTQLNGASGSRYPVERRSDCTSSSKPRTVSSPPSFDGDHEEYRRPGRRNDDGLCLGHGNQVATETDVAAALERLPGGPALPLAQ